MKLFYHKPSLEILDSVVKLKRIAIGSINYDRLPVGAYRELDAEEIKNIANPAKYPKQKAEVKDKISKPTSRSNASKKPFSQTTSKPKHNR